MFSLGSLHSPCMLPPPPRRRRLLPHPRSTPPPPPPPLFPLLRFLLFPFVCFFFRHRLGSASAAPRTPGAPRPRRRWLLQQHRSTPAPSPHSIFAVRRFLLFD